MRNFLHKSLLLLSLFAAVWSCSAEVEVLWWTVSADDDVDWYGNDVSVEDLPGYGVEVENGGLAARISYVDNPNNPSDSGYLNFWMLSNTEPPHPVPQDTVGMSSFMVPIDGYADVTDKAGYTFMIELGNFENGKWVAIVTGEAQSYSYLDAQESIGTWDMTKELSGLAGLDWSTSYAVPEPNSGVLLLLGGALLALRRRRNGGRA